jgi:hypothetical protein
MLTSSGHLRSPSRLGRLRNTEGSYPNEASVVPSEAEFLYYSKDTGFVRAASTESDTPLTKTLLERGDASLLLSVDNIRPSNNHLRKIIDQKNGSLKVDLKQAVPMQQLSETLNWSAIASMFPGDKSLGGFHYISFDPKSTWGQATKVPLVSGVGFWAWNFSTQSKPSVWTQMMSLLAGKKPPESSSTSSSSSSTTSSSVASPATSRSSRVSSVSKLAGRAVLGLGFPAIAETAFSAFGELFGSMFSQGSAKNEWIIHNADTPLLATQEARQKHPGHAIALRSGAYVVTSADSTQALLSGEISTWGRCGCPHRYDRRRSG